MLEITIWDVGHGNAAYIKTPNNRHISVDLGDTERFSPLQTLYARGVRQLDAVVITHPHRDHIDDIFNLGLLFPPVLHTTWQLSEDAIRKGNRTEDLEYVNRYLEIRRGCTFPVPPANNLTLAANFGGAGFQFFQPAVNNDENINNHSLVLVASYAGLKMVIPGDNEAPSWKELLKNPSFVAAISGADILLASHHGRDAGYCNELFEAMGKPKLVVISDGRFGDTSATDRYSKQATGWTVYDATGSSDNRKSVTTRSDGHITIKFGWNNEAERRNFLNVTTSKANINRLAPFTLGPLPRR